MAVYGVTAYSLSPPSCRLHEGKSRSALLSAVAPASAVSGPGMLQELSGYLMNEWTSGEAESGKEWVIEIKVNIQIHSCY